MDGKKNRVSGWGVRAPGWNNWKISDVENNDGMEAVDDEFGKMSLNQMDENDFAKWVSSKWNLKEFDGSIPVNERKNEWLRFIEQFGRIIAVRKLSSSQKLQALQIQAGPHLNDIIQIQVQRGVVTSEENYENVLSDLHGYFDGTCDSMQERSKFREMKMRSDESFVDYELRCEKQIKYCNFSKEQHDEELAEALIKRSVAEISKHLRLSALTLQTDIFAIIKQGTHLDHIRREESEIQKQQEEVVKPVMAVQREKYQNPRPSRFVPYQKGYKGGEKERPRNWIPKFRGAGNGHRKQDVCGKCAEVHQWGNCPASSRKCMKCNRWGHYAKCCRSTVSNDRLERKDNEAKTVNQVKCEDEKRIKCSSDEED